MYLCGYVLECFLKFVICEARKQKRLEMNEAKSLGHNLIELLHAARFDGPLQGNRDLWIAFMRINNRWAPEMRYSGKRTDGKTSEIFLKDTRDLRNWLQTRLRP